ncbi:glutamine synthetase family protein [Roseovarius sp. C7]|uniref:glutamine synthetase family protein n=1 Tax=Roseovarius sp. C7 TaxID=3398643 RepID=UPI0039F68F80
MSQDPHTIRVAFCDLNGVMRGKRLPGEYEDKLSRGAIKMPLSVVNVDITGADIEDSPLVFESGDADGVLLPTGRGPMPLPWLGSDQPLYPMELRRTREDAFGADPRAALRRVLARYEARGWSVQAATELEFTLVDDTGDELACVRNPLNGQPIEMPEVLALSHMDAFDAFLTDLYQGAEEMGIPAQTVTSEAGVGQFEITLDHQDALRAADDAWLFKALIRGLARKHGLAATFMAKPFGDDAGNGMHVHFSIWGAGGQNMMDETQPGGQERLHAALAGGLAAMAGATLIFAPHANSYARLVPGAHAPTAICWGEDNRTAALRIPMGGPQSRRIENRVAGGDTNPYLVLAAILGAAIHGIENDLTPPPPIEGNAYEQDLPQLAESWTEAIDRFESDPIMAEIFGPLLRDCLVRCKRQEVEMLSDVPLDEHWKTYLDTA